MASTIKGPKHVFYIYAENSFGRASETVRRLHTFALLRGNPLACYVPLLIKIYSVPYCSGSAT